MKVVEMSNDYEDFRVYGREMVDYLCDYMKNLSDKPVNPNVEPGYLAPLLDGLSFNFKSFFLFYLFFCF